jgi:putative endonuclease
MRAKDAVGWYGERVAADHLVSSGLVILDRNWRCPDGEIDIVARDGAALVFVEVKTRSSVTFGDPAEAVSRVKATRIRKLAMLWLEQNRDVPGAFRRELRFDVVSVVRAAAGPATVRHLRAAF